MQPISVSPPKKSLFTDQTNAAIIDKIKKEKSLKRKNYKFIDLFAGIGGIRLAFERTGCKCVFTSEWDEDCQKTYKANFKGEVHGDITKIEASDIPDHDILTGGFPCQAFSIIGSRKGFEDTRGTLFFDVARIIKEKQPYAFLLENVKQLTTHDDGKTFNVIISSLKELGYFVHYKVLNALDFGVPQRRTRVMIVGFKKNHPFEFPESGNKKLSLDEILEPEDQIHPKHLLSDHMRKKFLARVKHIPEGNTIWHENKSGNIGVHPYSCALRAGASFNYLTVNGKRRLTPRETLRLQGFPDDYKIIVPDGAIRRQTGNSVPVPMIQAVAECMIKAMDLPPVPNLFDLSD